MHCQDRTCCPNHKAYSSQCIAVDLRFVASAPSIMLVRHTYVILPMS